MAIQRFVTKGDVEDTDVVIVGSGFGGCVTAARLAEKARVVVLEKGKRWKSEDFEQSFNPVHFASLWDLWGGSGTGVLSGSGVGGGSLIYSQVSLRAPSFVFELDEDGRRLWPAEYSRKTLDPYYAKVEEMLKVVQLSFDPQSLPDAEKWRSVSRRDFVFAKGLARIGKRTDAMRVALHECNDCGWCSAGCRFGKKQSLMLNYVPLAESLGAEFREGCSCDVVEKQMDRYVVHFRDKRTREKKRIRAKVVILAGGAIASAGILLRSKRFAGLREVSAMAGERLSLNGDLPICGIVPDVTDTWKGKIDGSISYDFLEQGFTLQCVHLPPATGTTAMAFELIAPDGRTWGGRYKEYLREIQRHFLPLGVLGLDRSEGKVRVKADGSVVLGWKTHPETMRMWAASINAAHALVESLGGYLIKNPLETFGFTGTVHPLATCRMAESPEHGALSPEGEVFGYRNLFVVDGATIPAPIIVNTSLTIAAVAERIAERIKSRLNSQ
ncbi:MAG: GMC family oxidoreductase [Planctomycetes bacterium]|nr:GMC family oxidoreductase [Planctomycetota bacterium]